MASFSLDSDFNAVDWSILQNGAISLYFQPGVLAEDIDWLKEHGYIVHEFDCASWHIDADMHRDVSVALEFPDYHGENLDALNDAVGDIEFEGTTGVVLCFVNFDVHFAAEPNRAFHLLDIVECCSRFHLLMGNRLLALVQTNDPKLSRLKLGGCTANWSH